MDDVDVELDVVVVGAGVVGLAVARALACAGRGVHVLEAEARLGVHTSGRNSEVIHAGIYYPPGSLKARLCVAGRHALYAYCAARGIAHRRTGKLIVATDDSECAQLSAIATRARDNGVDDLTPRSAREVAQLEPAVRCVAALSSPSTGIVDSHDLIRALAADLRAKGGVIQLGARVRAGALVAGGFVLTVDEAYASGPTHVRARSLVNAAGLHAPTLAAALDGLDAAAVPRAHFAKGHYFTLRGRAPFSRLIYPVPVAHGLGVHVTLDLAGRARFGPDVSFVPAVDYGFDDTRRSAFAAAIRRYYPALDETDLEPAYTGIRPKLGPEGSAASDFVIAGPAVHGVAGLVQLFGIESPGLTACLAIADEVARDLTD